MPGNRLYTKELRLVINAIPVIEDERETAGFGGSIRDSGRNSRD